MFKYLRTLNNNVSAPEAFMLNAGDVNEEENYCKGAICTVFRGKLAYEPTGYLPKYCLLEDKAADDGKNTVLAMRLMPGMIFEVESQSTEDISVGTLVIAGADENNYIASIVESPENGDFEVLENHVNGITGLHTVIKI